MKVKSPSKHHSIEFLKFLVSNNYISAQGVEFCSEEVDLMLLEKCTDRDKFDSVNVWAVIFEEEFKQFGELDSVEASSSAGDGDVYCLNSSAVIQPPTFPWYLNINPSLERQK